MVLHMYSGLPCWCFWLISLLYSPYASPLCSECFLRQKVSVLAKRKVAVQILLKRSRTEEWLCFCGIIHRKSFAFTLHISPFLGSRNSSDNNSSEQCMALLKRIRIASQSCYYISQWIFTAFSCLARCSDFHRSTWTPWGNFLIFLKI